MKKIILPCLLAALSIAACKKSEEEIIKTQYYQDYNLRYFNGSDSFIASASFRQVNDTSVRILLGKKETILFNERPCDYIKDNMYWWTGKGLGKPNARFDLQKGYKSHSYGLDGHLFSDRSITAADTFYKSEGFSMVIKNLSPRRRNKYIHFFFPDRGITMDYTWDIDTQLNSDSIFLATASVKDMPDGRLIIKVYDSKDMETTDTDDGDKGNLNYWMEWDKEVWVMP